MGNICEIKQDPELTKLGTLQVGQQAS